MTTINVDALIAAHEEISHDPDAPVAPATMGALMRGALSGARVGYENRAPAYISVDADFLRRIPTC